MGLASPHCGTDVKARGQRKAESGKTAKISKRRNCCRLNKMATVKWNLRHVDR